MRWKASKWLGRIGLPMLAATTVVSGQATTSQSQGQTTFRGRSDYVTTDVIAKDAGGQFVADLRPGDFEIYEDGVRQTVAHFEPIIGGRAMGDLAPTAFAAPREGLILPKSRPRTDVSGRIFIIFIDDMHLQPSDSVRARKVLEQIRDEVIHDNDLIGLVSTGFSSISTDLTYDFNRRRFNEAIGKLMGSGDTPQEILAMPESSEGISKLRYNANVAFRTAYDILKQASQITDRRKSFIYVSSGYSFNPFKDSRYKQAKEQYEWMTASGDPEPTDPDSSVVSPPIQSRWENPFESSGQQFAETDLVAQIAELTRAARRANVVFYTVDPRGLDAGPTLNNTLSVGEWREWITTTVSSLQILAEETGGFAIVNTNDFRRGLQRIDAETSDYYIIGYSSTNPDPLRVRRMVEIKTPNRPDVTLQYKPEYTLDRSSRGR
jgi:VWFA-related protein